MRTTRLGLGVVGVAAVALAIVSPVGAESITFVAEGDITFLEDTGNLTGGATTWSWTYTFDSDAPDQKGDPDQGIYALGDWELTIGTLTVSSTGDQIQVGDDIFGVWDVYWGFIFSPPAGWTSFSSTLQLLTFDLSTFESDALPLTPPNPLDFPFASFNVSGTTQGGDSLQVSGDVATITLLAPACTVDLVADGGSEETAVVVGSVTTTPNDDGTWTVTYETTDGWRLEQTHLHVACDLDGPDGIPQRRGNPLPGRFDHATDHDPLVQTFSYVVDDPGCDCPLFAAHAKVVDTDDCELIDGIEVCREETGWGDGVSFPGHNWGTYFECGDCE